MSDIRTPILRVIKRLFGENSISKYFNLELDNSYFSDNGLIIEHFKFDCANSTLIRKLDCRSYGFILQDLNDFFNNISMPRKCVGVYFEGDFLNILIRG